MRKFVRNLAGPSNPQTKRRPQDRRGQHGGEGQHAGLLLQRYLCEKTTGDGGNPEEKRAILQAAISAATNSEVCQLYEAAFDRWTVSLPTDPPPIELATTGRLIVGLGSENVLETGIRLHHNYGMPIIPGSALKGLAAHYCHETWGPTDEKFRRGGEFHQLLFGTTDDGGCIIFHDAWLTPDSRNSLVLDVMTPHHPDYNRDPNTDPKFRAPTDFDSPIPVPFLSVTGKFRVAVAWHGPASDEAKNKAKNWTELAISLVCDALKDWGIGGKTTSGYGRLTVPLSPPPPPPPKKRASSENAKVKIIAPRPKGGFDVQDVEPGRNRGTLTVGTTPPGTDTNQDSIVDVLVHIDDMAKPQYKWPQLLKK